MATGDTDPLARLKLLPPSRRPHLFKRPPRPPPALLGHPLMHATGRAATDAGQVRDENKFHYELPVWVCRVGWGMAHTRQLHTGGGAWIGAARSC